MSFSFHQRRRKFEYFLAQVLRVEIPQPNAGGAVFAPPQPSVRYPCPSCGYPTLTERAGYDVCWICGWEDDGQDDPNADEVWGGPNGSLSLSDARREHESFVLSGQPYPEGRLTTPELERARRDLFDTYNTLLTEPDEAEQQRLWQRILQAEQVVDDELTKALRLHHQV